MKKHYQTLGLQEGASQQEVQEAYDRLSKELDPANNDKQEFFKEEYKKVQEAFKALSNSSILATDKGAKQIFKKPTSTSKKKSDATKPTKEKLDTPKKKIVKRDVILFFIAIGIWGLLLQNMGFFDYLQRLHFHNGTLTTYSARRIHLNAKSEEEIDNMLKSYGFTTYEIFAMGSGKKVTEIIKFQDEVIKD